MTQRPAIDRARSETANLQWLMAGGDEALSRERHSVLLLDISDTVTTIATDLNEHIAHPTPHAAATPTMPGATAVRAFPTRHPKTATAAAGTSIAAVAYGIIELARTLIGS